MARVKFRRPKRNKSKRKRKNSKNQKVIIGIPKMRQIKVPLKKGKNSQRKNKTFPEMILNKAKMNQKKW